jgi:hypothetical protein
MSNTYVYLRIYNDGLLAYPLKYDECANLAEVWEFIENFTIPTCTLHGYRTTLIETVRQKYTPYQFYNLELLTEKLFWNLRYKTYRFFADNDRTPIDNLLGLKEGQYESLLQDMYNDNSYRSFINKLILIDDVNNKCYYKKMEGSADIFNKNRFNLYTGTVLFNRHLYETVMSDPEKIINIHVPTNYYEHDYAFPNLNNGKPFMQSPEYRMKRIRKMYYDVNAESNWYKLLKP